MQSPACIWIEDWRFHRNSFLKSSILPICGGDWGSEEKILWNLQSEEEKASIRLPIPFHSIRPSVHPSFPSTHTVHPSILSAYLSTYLSFDPSIYLIMKLSYNVAILGLHVDWRFKKEQSSVQRRVQRVPTTRSIEKPFSRHARQPALKQSKPTIQQNMSQKMLIKMPKISKHTNPQKPVDILSFFINVCVFS